MALDLIAELEAVIAALEASSIEYALCGGLAVAAHGHVRTTKDIDLLVRPEDVPQILVIAKSLGFDVPSRKMVFRAGHDDEHHMQRVSKLDPETNDLLSLDLLLVGPVYESSWSSRTRIPWRATNLQIVSRAGLATMKRLAGRPQDLADIAALDRIDDEEA
jgi:hypothetical protein